MSTSRILFLVLIYLMAFNVHCTPIETKESIDELIAKARDKSGAPSGETSSIQSQAVQNLNEEIQVIARQEYKDWVKHKIWQRKFIESSWNLHFYSSALIFLIVCTIILFSLYITYLQFNRNYPPQIATPPVSGDPNPPPPIIQPPDELKMTASGLEIKSQTIGLIILAMSFAFFFLYVKFVYPMQISDTEKQADKLQQLDAQKEKKAPNP